LASRTSGEAEEVAWRKLIPLVLGAFVVAVEDASAPPVVFLVVGRLISAAGAALYIPNAGAYAAALSEQRKGRALSLAGLC
jgi:hypothetical protein